MHVDLEISEQGNAAYWAALLIIAIEHRSKEKAKAADAQLRQHGFALTRLRPASAGQRRKSGGVTTTQPEAKNDATAVDQRGVARG